MTLILFFRLATLIENKHFDVWMRHMSIYTCTDIQFMFNFQYSHSVEKSNLTLNFKIMKHKDLTR